MARGAEAEARAQSDFASTSADVERLGGKAAVPAVHESLTKQILDVVNRPQQALYQVADGILSGEDDFGVLLGKAWSGLDGTGERITFSDFLSNAGFQDGRAVSIAGFAGDVAFDPLNVLPVGAVSKLNRAVRVALTGSARGRQALQWATEVYRDLPILGSARSALHRMFINRPDVSPDAVRPFVKSIIDELDAYKKAREVVVRGDRIRVYAPPRKGAPEVLEIEGNLIKPVVDPYTLKPRIGKDDLEFLQARVNAVQEMQSQYAKGVMPERVIADWMKTMQSVSHQRRRQLAQSVLPMISAFHRDFVMPMSRKDQQLVVMAAEELGIADEALMAQKLAPLKAQADNWEQVQAGAVKFRQISEKLEDVERETGIKIARLGGALEGRRKQIMLEAQTALAVQSTEVLDKVADAFRTFDFGSKVANDEARSLGVLFEGIKDGYVEWGAVQDYLVRNQELRSSLSVIPLGDKEAAKLGSLSRLVEEAQQGTGIMRADAAYQFLKNNIVNHDVAAGKLAILTKREESMKQLQELLEKVPGYALHYMTKDATEALATNIAKHGGSYAKNLGSARHQSMILRKFQDGDNVPLSIQEVDRVLKTPADQLDALGKTFLKTRRSVWEVLSGKPASVGRMFGINPTEALASRVERTAKAYSAKTWHDDVSRIFGGYRGPDFIPGERLGLPAGTKYDPQIAEAISATKDAYFTDVARKTILRNYDAIQSVWKATTLFPFPAYHFRNSLGDFWLMNVGGFFSLGDSARFWSARPDVEAPLDLMRAMRAQMHIRTGNVDALEGLKFNAKGRTYSVGEVFKMMQDRGALGIGFFADNMAMAAEKEAMLGPGLLDKGGIIQAARDLADIRTFAMPSQVHRNPVLRAGRSTAEAISDTNRLAFVMKRLRMGDDIDEAIAHTNHYMIDYLDLTPFEIAGPRRVAPFYTWTRFALPLSIEALVQNPRRVNRITHAIDFAKHPDSPVQPFLSFLNGDGDPISDDEAPRPVDIPKWMQQAVPFDLRRNRQTGMLEMFTIGAWHPFAEVEKIAPQHLGKTFLDMMSPLIKVPIETALKRNLFFDSELTGKTEFMGREMPAVQANAWNNIRLLAEFDRMNLFSAVRDGQFSTRRLRPETEESVRQKVLRFFTGAKIYPLDTRMARYRNLQPAVKQNRIQISRRLGARRREADREDSGG